MDAPGEYTWSYFRSLEMEWSDGTCPMGSCPTGSLRVIICLRKWRCPVTACHSRLLCQLCVCVCVCACVRAMVGWRDTDVYTCSKCDKIYGSRRQLSIHESYCNAKLWFGGVYKFGRPQTGWLQHWTYEILSRNGCRWLQFVEMSKFHRIGYFFD